MLDVTKEDIYNLNDTDLRILIGKLCEAELNKMDISSNCVYYGGNQDAKDDGIDVLIKTKKSIDENSFIKSKNTIIQVKRTKMTPAKIKEEMSPKGVIRPSIKELNGSYIIVSSADDLTYPACKKRVDVMQKILDENKVSSVSVNFYDANKIASWVRSYPALIFFVNDKNKKNTFGWFSYYSWSNDEDFKNRYITSDNFMISKKAFNNPKKINIIDGINEIRNTLRKERSSVRVSGLSGTGKTALARVLFDETVGRNALNKEIVIYGDALSMLSPDPISFVGRLSTLNKRIILIVDNCRASLHYKLAKLCKFSGSKLSLMTIHYSFSEDNYANTSVYYIEKAPNNIIKEMLKEKFPKMSSTNISSIVDASMGNFKIAIYLAETVKENENKVLKSSELFNRLFFQDEKIDNNLLRVSEAISLFSSFRMVYNPKDKKNDINIISKLLHIDPLILFESINKLEKKHLVEISNQNMYVVPHVLANKFALDYLKKYPKEHIMQTININTYLSLQLFKRLNHINSYKEVKELTVEYLKQIDLINISNIEIRIVYTMAKIYPYAVLNKIKLIKNKRFFTSKNKNYIKWIHILSIIAIRSELFIDSFNLIIKLILNNTNKKNDKIIDNYLIGFYNIYSITTNASIKKRLKIIKSLLEYDDKRYVLGLKLLRFIVESKGHYNRLILWNYENTLAYKNRIKNKYKSYKDILEFIDTLLKDKDNYIGIKDIIIDNFVKLSYNGFYNELEYIVLNNFYQKDLLDIYSLLIIYKCLSNEAIYHYKKLIRISFPKTINDKVNIYFNKNIIEKNFDVYLPNMTYKNIYKTINKDLFDNVVQNSFELIIDFKNGGLGEVPPKIKKELINRLEEYKKINTPLSKEMDNLENYYYTYNKEIYDLGKKIALDKKNFKYNILLFNNSGSLNNTFYLAFGLYFNTKSKTKLLYKLYDLKNKYNYKFINKLLMNLAYIINLDNPNINVIVNEDGIIYKSL